MDRPFVRLCNNLLRGATTPYSILTKKPRNELCAVFGYNQIAIDKANGNSFGDI